jgi:hypothetical protein
MSLIEKYDMIDALDRIENKILETGAFTKLLGSYFSLSIEIEEDIELDRPVFDIHTNIITDERVSSSQAEIIADSVSDRFYSYLLYKGIERQEVSNFHREDKVTVNCVRVW